MIPGYFYVHHLYILCHGFQPCNMVLVKPCCMCCSSWVSERVPVFVVRACWSSYAGLLSVTAIDQDRTLNNLTWMEPQNAPAGCIESYIVTWNGHNVTTQHTSISINSIAGLDFCQTYSIAVTPVGPLGAIQSSRAVRDITLMAPGNQVVCRPFPSISHLFPSWLSFTRETFSVVLVHSFANAYHRPGFLTRS